MNEAAHAEHVTPLTVDNTMMAEYTAVAVDEGVKAVDGNVRI